MIRIEDNCVCCDLPCVNCGRKHEKVLYCDECGDSFETCYNYKGQDLCEDCFLRQVFIDLSIEELANMVNEIFNTIIYKIVDNKFYVDDREDGNFEETDETDFLSYLENDFYSNIDIEKIIDYIGNIDIINLD